MRWAVVAMVLAHLSCGRLVGLDEDPCAQGDCRAGDWNSPRRGDRRGGDLRPPLGDAAGGDLRPPLGDAVGGDLASPPGDPAGPGGDSTLPGDPRVGDPIEPSGDPMVTGDTMSQGGPGSPCIADGACNSGRCIDNRCCASSDCDPECQTCSATGACSDASRSCGQGTGTCVEGICRLNDGQPCAVDTDCANAACADCDDLAGCPAPRVCCAEACGECNVCNGAGTTCRPLDPGDPCGFVDCSDVVAGPSVSPELNLRCHAKDDNHFGDCDRIGGVMMCVGADCSFAGMGSHFKECGVGCQWAPGACIEGAPFSSVSCAPNGTECGRTCSKSGNSLLSGTCTGGFCGDPTNQCDCGNYLCLDAPAPHCAQSCSMLNDTCSDACGYAKCTCQAMSGQCCAPGACLPPSQCGAP